MTEQELSNRINDALSKNIPPEKIFDILINDGWQAEYINPILERLLKTHQNNTPVIPTASPKTTGNTFKAGIYFLLAIVFTAIGFATTPLLYASILLGSFLIIGTIVVSCTIAIIFSSLSIIKINSKNLNGTKTRTYIRGLITLLSLALVSLNLWIFINYILIFIN